MGRRNRPTEPSVVGGRTVVGRTVDAIGKEECMGETPAGLWYGGITSREQWKRMAGQVA